MQDYLACVQGIDDNVGKLLDHLADAGLADDTIVIYASCSGASLGDLGLCGAGFMYEPGIRLPLIVSGPGVPAGTAEDAFVADVDLAPTCVELAGLPVPESMPGRSAVPLLRAAPPAGWRRSVLCRGVADPRQPSPPAFVGVRTPTHKLIHYPQQDAWELFDLGADPHEQRNLLFEAEEANSRGVANTFAALKAEMARLQHGQANDGGLANPAASPTPAPTERGGDGEVGGMKTIAEAIGAAAARRTVDRAGEN
jgi:arylsulfatase A-like enzyme